MSHIGLQWVSRGDGKKVRWKAYDAEFVSILLADRPRVSADEGALRVENERQWGVTLLSSST